MLERGGSLPAAVRGGDIALPGAVGDERGGTPVLRGFPILAIAGLVILFPVVTVGPVAEALGGRGDLLRAGFLVGMLGLAALTYGPGIPKPPRRLRPVVAGLLILAGFGGVSAIANETSAQSTASLAGQLVGQPLVMAGLLVYFSAFLRSGERATDWLLAAFAVGVAGEAVVVLAELLSGAAYDELRELTRAQGTVGANFIGAFAMMAIFIGLAGWQRGPKHPSARAVAGVTLLAGAVIIVGAVARSALIGVLVGGIYVVLAEPRYRRRALPIAVAAALVALATLPTPAGELWTSRLDAGSVQAFDRPGTWISGMRIGFDHPLTGKGEREIVRDIDDVRRYRQTPLGDSDVIPHNSWILTFAEGGAAALVMILALTWLAFLAVRPPPGGRSTEERFYVAGLLGIGTIALVNNVFRHPELMAPTLMMIAILAARGERRSRDQSRSRPMEHSTLSSYDPPAWKEPPDG